MPQALATLGDYQFSLDNAAFQDYGRDVDYRWHQHDRLGREPAQQYMGRGTDQISLKGTIYPTFKGGLGQLDSMREAADKGEPLQYIDGRGNVIGNYCIKSVKETGTVFFENGAPRKMTFDLVIVRYGDDETGGAGGGSGYSGIDWGSFSFGLFA